MPTDPRPNYIYLASPKRAEDFAPIRELRVSLRPASIIGPCLAIILLAAGAGLAYLVWTLSQAVTR
jgi:hypothetical protein